jgi:predicted MFS family arabinose efflux permease
VDRPLAAPFFATLLAAYFCAGVGFVVSATFIVAIVNALPGLAGHGTRVFLWMGLAGAPSCMLWDLLARRSGEINALIVAAAVQIVGILLPVWPGGWAAAVVGGILFGGSFVGVVSLVLTLAGRYYPTRPATMMGRMTMAYGTAQILAPALTAWLATQSGTYATGLYVAAASMLACTLLLLALKGIPPSPQSL